MKDGKKTKGTLRWLSRVSSGKKGGIATLALLQAVLGAGDVWSALLLKRLIDGAVAQNRQAFFIMAVAFAVLLTIQILLRAVNRFLQEWTRSSLENQFKQRLFACLLRKDYAQVTAVHSGEWMNRLTTDTMEVANGLCRIVPDLSGLVVKLVGALAALLLLIPELFWLLIPGSLVFLVLTACFRTILKDLHRRVRETDGAVRIFLQERLNCLLIVRSFSREDQTLKEAQERMKDHHAARIRRNHFHNLCNVGFNVALDGVYLLGALSCGYGILTGTFSYGTFIAVLQLVGQIQSPLANLTGFLPQFYALLASAERLMEAERFPEEEVRGKLPATENWYRDSFRGLELRDVSFTYRSASGEGSGVMPVVFRDISFAIHKGEYVALTGASGSGKSTLLKLILCLYPLDRGERYLVSSFGQEELTPAWRRLFAYVPQGNQLMSGTIREVVAFGDQEKMWQDERVTRALRIACAEGFVLRQERGLDSLLGERGAGLSDGQMQRLAIARAIFSGRPILLLDEATSALDEATEARLLRNLRQMTERTVIIVTHRPAALSIVDRCVEIDVSEGAMLREGRSLDGSGGGSGRQLG